MSTFDTAEILTELATLADRNIYARECLREFLNTKPVIGTLQSDEPSEALARCLAACRAIAFELTPEMAAAGADVLVYLLRDGESPKEVATAVFEAMLSAAESRLHQPQEP